MRYYRFKTFTTCYYFPKVQKEQEFLYGLYSAYGGLLSKFYWTLFQKFSFVRTLTSIQKEKLPFPYHTIKEILGKDTVLSFNMGSPGVEQKISILGYDNRSHLPFFAKFSQKEAAKKLTKNEIKVYQLLENTELTPKLLDYEISDDYVCLKAEFVKGMRPKGKEMNSRILKLCLKLKDYSLEDSSTGNNELLHCLSHGDFCPWNMLVDNNNIKLIDWELASERPLGFDLFTYITQVSILFNPEQPLLHVIDENMEYINRYFEQCNVKDYIPYLSFFAKEKAEYEKGKGNNRLYSIFQQLENSL